MSVPRSHLKLHSSNYVFLLLISFAIIIASIAICAKFAFYSITVSHYSEGHCIVLSKRLRSIQSNYVVTYRPDFSYRVLTANGKTYQASGYDGMALSTINYREEQAVVDYYHIGYTYPCWYNQDNPTAAVLTRMTPFIPIFSSILGFFLGFFLFLFAYSGYQRHSSS